MKLTSWLDSWATTLRIMFFERETYRALTEPFNPADYVEASRPGELFEDDTEGPCCGAWVYRPRQVYDDDLCPHDSCWRIMGCNNNPPVYENWRNHADLDSD